MEESMQAMSTMWSGPGATVVVAGKAVFGGASIADNVQALRDAAALEA